MKILCIVADIKFNKYGGAEAHFVQVLKRILPNIEKAVIIVGDDDSIKKEFSDNNIVEIIKINYPHIANFYSLFFIFFATLKLLIRRPNYDLIWAKQEYPQAQVGAILKIFTGKPLYITSQNPMLGEEELVGVGGNLVKFLVSFAFYFADTVAAVSNYSADLAKKLGAKKVIIIPNGI